MQNVDIYDVMSDVVITERKGIRRYDEQQWENYYGPYIDKESKYFAEYFAEWFDAYEAAESDNITLTKDGTKYELSVKNSLGEEMLNVSFTRKEITKDEFADHAGGRKYK